MCAAARRHRVSALELSFADHFLSEAEASIDVHQQTHHDPAGPASRKRRRREVCSVQCAEALRPWTHLAPPATVRLAAIVCNPAGHPTVQPSRAHELAACIPLGSCRDVPPTHPLKQRRPTGITFPHFVPFNVNPVWYNIPALGSRRGAACIRIVLHPNPNITVSPSTIYRAFPRWA